MNLVDWIDAVNARMRWAALLPAAAGLLYASGAAAQECQVDADCGAGYVCAVSQGGGCSQGPCTVGGECPPPVCETFEYRYCNVAPCATDADCPDSMRCHTEHWEECSASAGVGCARGEDVCDGGTPTDYTCSEHTRSACAERYNLPCEADADCGRGFDCTELISTRCSGGGGARPDGDGGFVFEPVPTECVSEPTGEYYCKLRDLPCATDAECPEGLTCQQDLTGATPCGGGFVGGGASLGGAGTPVVIECPPPPPVTFSCKPRGYNGGGGIVGGGTGAGSGGVDPTGPGRDAGVDDPDAPGSGSVGGSAGGVGGGAAGGNGGSDPGAPSDDDEDEESGHGRGSRRLGRLLRHLFGSGGCSLGGAVPAGDLSWLAVAGLLGLARRRRD